jgi:hypothetical protein
MAEDLEHTARTLVGKLTDAMIDAEAEARGVDRAWVIRYVLDEWAHLRDHAATLLKAKLRSQGQERAEEGVRGHEG